jgi:hypothetical protein
MTYDSCFIQIIPQAITELTNHDSPVNNEIFVVFYYFILGLPWNCGLSWDHCTRL